MSEKTISRYRPFKTGAEIAGGRGGGVLLENSTKGVGPFFFYLYSPNVLPWKEGSEPSLPPPPPSPAIQGPGIL
jgi:hypothetical protein